MPTSLISRIKKDNFIIFKSSNEDIELFGRTDKKFRFSHFALLDIPDIKEAVSNANVLDFTRIQSRFVTGNSTVSPPAVGDSIDLSESFQNYLLNFEELLTSSDEYDRDIIKNANERIFFKWLKEVGALRYRTALNTETNFSGRYTEESENFDSLNGNLYSRVVKYVAEISFQNKTTNNKNNFEEILIMIPSFAGNTPVVLFKTIEDNNYKPLTAISRTDAENAEYINGYTASSPMPPNGLELLAQYDIDITGLTYTSTNDSNPLDTSLWFDFFSGTDAYLTEKTFTDPTNDTITVDDGVNTKTFLRSRLDGVTIDLDKSSYAEINTLPNRTFSDYSAKGESFDFNAILLYYELERNGVTETNLFGVWFLGDVTEITGGQSKIERLPKIKQSTLLQQTGNGYGFKLNFRVDAVDNNIVVDVNSDVNDYNVFSMHLFSETMGRFNKVLTNYDDLVASNRDLLQQNQQLMGLISESNKSLAKQQLEEIFKLLTTNTEFTGLSSLIEKNTRQIENILKNQTSVEVDVVLDPFGTNGVLASISGSLLKVELSEAEFSASEVKQASVVYGNKNEFSIGRRNKILILSSDNSQISQSDINIFLDDSFTSWKTLQSVRIMVDDKINLAGFNVNIFTDKKSIFSNESYGLQLCSIKPKSNIITVVCISENEYKFVVG